MMNFRISGGRSGVLLALAFVATIAGCAINGGMGKSPEVSLKDKYQESYDFSKIKAIVVLPFSETYKSATDILFRPVNSKDAISESVSIFSIELFDAGINVIDRALLHKVLSEQKLSISGLMEQEDYQKIGKLVNADAILFVNRIIAF